MNCSPVTTPLVATALALFSGADAIVVAADQPASVRLSVSPVEQQVCDCLIVTNSQVTLEADVSDIGGQVTRVEFYREYTKIGEATSAPYALAGQELASEQNFFRAAATDNRGTVTFSPWLKVQGPEFTTVFPSGAAWRFLDDGSDQGSAWKDPDFNASGWKSGQAPLGFGDGQVTDLLPEVEGHRVVTHYFRKEFEVVKPSEQVLQFGLQADDGAVVYLNGFEIFRFNMPTGAVTSATLALMPNPIGPRAPFFRTNLFAYIYDVAFFERTLRPGRNVLAVELHQSVPPDSSARFDLWLKTFTADSRCCPAFSPMSAKAIDGKVVLEFRGTLMTAEDVNGPYEPLPSAASPATVVPAGKARFYRAE